MNVLSAHAICLGLVGVDLAARSWRIKFFLRGIGHRVTFRESLTLNAWGDAASAVTPLRFGGEPARLAGMLRSRVPPPAAFVAIGYEVLLEYPAIGIATAVLAWRYAPGWWQIASPGLARTGQHAWQWVTIVALLSIVAWLAGRRLGRTFIGRAERPVRRVRVYWRRMPRWPAAASVPFTLISAGARVAILPVLTLTLPEPLPLGPVALGSFALLYSQLLLPTPSGAGVVDLGFLGGAAGNLGPGDALLLLAWRMYTNGIGVILGVALAVRELGWPALKKAVRRTGGREDAPSTDRPTT
jgi:uncharacterized membrane protein YbhN (UPF0104 family)